MCVSRRRMSHSRSPSSFHSRTSRAVCRYRCRSALGPVRPCRQPARGTRGPGATPRAPVDEWSRSRGAGCCTVWLPAATLELSTRALGQIADTQQQQQQRSSRRTCGRRCRRSWDVSAPGSRRIGPAHSAPARPSPAAGSDPGEPEPRHPINLSTGSDDSADPQQTVFPSVRNGQASSPCYR